MRREDIFNRLSTARMQPFLTESDGNYKDALALYKWHMELSSAVKEVLAFTEIIVRNAIDEKLTPWNERELGRPKSWLLEVPAAPLASIIAQQRTSANRSARASVRGRPSTHPRHDCVPNHDDVLAHTTFGLWKVVLPNHRPGASTTNPQNQGRKKLWEEAIESAFPHVEDRDGSQTYWNVVHCNELRNKVAHMDSLLNVDVIDESRRAFALIRAIDPQLSTWVSSQSRVSAIFNKRPGK